MPSFQYATTSGALKTFDAPDQATAMRQLSTFADRDPISGVRMLSAPASTPGAAGAGTGTAPPATAAPAAPDYGAIAQNAGQAGLSYGDYSKLFAPTDEEQKAAQDEVAKQFGYADYSDFIAKAFTAPSQTTTDFYNNAYSAAGLDKLVSDITGKKNKLNEAIGTINDNPWFEEAFRRGEAARLQNLAGADIKNLEDEYKLRLGHVHDLLTQHATDLSQEEKARQAQLQYLEKYASDAATRKAAARASEYLDKYEAGKKSTQKPQTVSVPGTSNVYQYDPMTGSWNLIQKAQPKPVASSRTRKTSPTTSSQQKVIDSFSKALANRTALNKAGTREQFIRQLRAQFPQIDPASIAEYVYGTYPDHYDGK